MAIPSMPLRMPRRNTITDVHMYSGHLQRDFIIILIEFRLTVESWTVYSICERGSILA